MAIQVEIYDERELNPATLTREDDAEALAIIAELGLSKQTHEDGVRIAYPKPTVDQSFTMSVLFPQKSKLEDYDAGTIPLRVLKELRSYRAEHPDHRLYVLHAPPAVVRDPVLIACDNVNAWNDGPSQCRMIARWGDALAPWGELLGEAKKIHGKVVGAAVESMIRKLHSLRDHLANGGDPGSETQMPQLFSMPKGWE